MILVSSDSLVLLLRDDALFPFIRFELSERLSAINLVSYFRSRPKRGSSTLSIVLGFDWHVFRGHSQALAVLGLIEVGVPTILSH